MKPRHELFIDVVDACNLQCTDCGHWQLAKNTSQVLTLDRLSLILDKAQSECNVVRVGLHNWAEPLLHPQLPEIVGAIKDRGIPCCLSTNLSFKHIPTLERLIQREPDLLVVSVSGFSQEIYSRYHRRGDIDLVKSNLELMAELVNKHAPGRVAIRVDYLRFVDNAEEGQLMRQFCNELGIGFLQKQATGRWGISTEESKQRLLVPAKDPREHQLSIDHPEPKMLWPCRVLDDMVTMNVRGSAYLCCVLWYFREYRIANFLDTPLEELYRRRLQHPKCKTCRGIRRPPQKSDLLLRYSKRAIEQEELPAWKRQMVAIRDQLLKSDDS